MPAPPELDRIDVWQVDLAQSASTLAQLYPLLSPAEQARAARFVYPQHRDRYIVAHAALRMILGSVLACAPATLVFDEGPNGKPYLAGRPVHFNLTHAGTLALVAVARTRRLGVDLEPIRELPDALSLAEQFHPAELASLRASHPDPRAFFECWTCKEAFVKATGEGLSRPLNGFQVTFHPRAPGLVEQPAWHLFGLRIPGHAAALVAEAIPNQPPPTMHFQTWSPEPSA